MEIKTDAPRPKTSTRDREQLQRNLQAWIGGRLPGAQVSNFAAPTSNGMSSETVLFDLDWQEDGAARQLGCVLRLPPASNAAPVFPVYDMEKQFRVMQLARERSAVPVPRTLWYENDPAHLGDCFFVMERIDGIAPPDIPPYVFDSWLLRAEPAQQQTMQRSSIEALAGLHAIPLDAADLDYLRPAESGSSALRRHIASQRTYYEWVVSDGIRQPLIERVFAWMEDNFPQDEGPEVLSWGDARMGNMLFRDFRPVAVLDWEMVSTGPREMDLGWMVYLHHFFQDFTPLVGLPGIPSMMRIDEAARTYEQASGHRVRNLEFFMLYSALRHAIVMARIARRQALFGESPMPANPDDAIPHAASIEAMMAGTYWETRR